MKQLKIGISLLLVFCLQITAVFAAAKPQQEEPPHVQIKPGDVLPNVTARSAVVMEAATGKILYARDMDEKRYPASTTKIMTLIIALEQGNLDDIVTVSENASHTEGSTLWLEPGEKIKLSDLLYGMMLISGNDATVAVAEHIAGSVDAFARLMTAKAHEIGAQNTSFVNSSGLPDDRHFTTAHDLALIAAYGYRNPEFAEIVSTKEWKIPWPTHIEDRELKNENQMLWLYRGGNGVKTGYTDAAGRCLVSAASRDGIQLISVVLDSLYMWNDSIALLDYGFRQTNTKEVVHEGDVVKTIRVISGRQDTLALKAEHTLSVPEFENEKLGFYTRIDAPDRLQAGMKAGDAIGRLVVLYDGKEIASTNLVAADTVEKKSFFTFLSNQLTRLFQILFA